MHRTHKLKLSIPGLSTGLCYSAASNLILTKTSKLVMFVWQLCVMIEVHQCWFIPWVIQSRETILTRVQWMLLTTVMDACGIALAFHADQLPLKAREESPMAPPSLSLLADESSDLPSDWGLGIKTPSAETRFKKRECTMPPKAGIFIATLWLTSFILSLDCFLGSYFFVLRNMHRWTFILFCKLFCQVLELL
eukprot:Blabericola_migrator_1__5018@NODE_2602_length_2552_cov_213_241449_g1632_i0_p2_GENE_NODE_2602_length_2552_cov_213_241449_g1632_i0NODE_2602_length_2552_cov_213_241449_g1632_i0_p2_ORF_typecomplete_len193_score34_93DUF2809/PF10990_8/0_026DUF2809/PF10990_8/4e02ATHILA/PF03078_15/0_31_NODE_2602_length_2552_cov_213_241449_g1632_i0135713